MGNTNYKLVNTDEMRLVTGQASTFYAFTERLQSVLTPEIFAANFKDLGDCLNAYEVWNGKFSDFYKEWKVAIDAVVKKVEKDPVGTKDVENTLILWRDPSKDPLSRADTFFETQ